MGLICPKCHTDNLLTAVFCRGCGDKLDLSAMKPEDLLNDSHTKTQKKGASKGQKIFVGIFFGVLALIILLAMCPVGVNGTEEGEVDAAVAKSFTKLAKAGKKKKGASLSFDDNTASKLLTKAMELPKSEWAQGPLVPQHFSVAFNEDSTIKIVVKAKAFGAVPVSCSAVGTFTKAEGAKEYECNLSSPKLGMLPMFIYGELCTDLIKNLGTSCPAVQGMKKASEITISAGQVSVNL